MHDHYLYINYIDSKIYESDTMIRYLLLNQEENN